MEEAGGVFVEQVIRPTGLIDPPVEIRPAKHQVDDVLGEIREVADKGYRTLVTTLTKRMAEDLTEYLHDHGVRVRYMHSDIDTIERIEIIRDLRLGRVRRAGRHQPPARGARHPRVRPGGDPRRRQGRLPALGNLADPDHRPRGAQRRRQGDPLRRQHDRLDGTRHRRDQPPAREAARLQRRERDHAESRSNAPSATFWRASTSATTCASTRGWRTGRPASATTCRSRWRTCSAACARPPRTWSSRRPPACATRSSACEKTELMLSADPMARQRDIEVCRRPLLGGPGLQRLRQPEDARQEAGPRRHGPRHRPWPRAPQPADGRRRGRARPAPHPRAQERSRRDDREAHGEVQAKTPPKKPEDDPGLVVRHKVGIGSHEDPADEKKRARRKRKTGRPGN